MRSSLHMALLVDSHCDLAWNMLTFGRDYARAAAETRALEQGGDTPARNGDTLIGWPDYQRGQVAIVFSTLFVSPTRRAEAGWERLSYANADEAHRLYQAQLDLYRELVESQGDKFRFLLTSAEVRQHVEAWQRPAPAGHAVGLVPLMEGADGIRSIDELEEWHDRGLRLIGLAWSGTRYSGGTHEPGPLTDDGKQLLRAMAEHGFILDLTHMDERAASEALDVYEGPIVATHVNCLALLPGFPTNRHFSDKLLRSLIERGGVIGNVPVNSFLKPGWTRASGSRREEVPLDTYVAHLDHVCQLAGDALHAGIGSDFDGGFGLQSVPPEIDTIADLQKIGPMLLARGYSDADAANILGGNWIRFLEASLPGSK